MRFVVAVLIGIIALNAQADADNSYQLTVKAQELVKDRLKDPDAAQFRGLYPNTLPNGGVVICGEVNSKNKYGGYEGYQKFFSTGTFVRFREDAPSTFDGVYKMVCPK
ncbi:UNVERIFIED_ORG: hypothetical protein J2W87_001256 [Pseudomonas putida]|nr:hypothetical protein [Pseudomonas putida]